MDTRRNVGLGRCACQSTYWTSGQRQGCRLAVRRAVAVAPDAVCPASASRRVRIGHDGRDELADFLNLSFTSVRDQAATARRTLDPGLAAERFPPVEGVQSIASSTRSWRALGGVLQPVAGRGARTQTRGAAGRDRGGCCAGRMRGGPAHPARPLGADELGRKVGRVLGRRKMGKHFECRSRTGSYGIGATSSGVDVEARLDGIYVLRTQRAGRAAVEPEHGAHLQHHICVQKPGDRCVHALLSSENSTGR